MGWGKLIKRAAVDGVHSLFAMPPFEAALTRFTRDHQISDLVARLAPVNQQYRHPTYRHVIRNDIHFRLDISDYQDWIVYWGITTDRPEELYMLIQEEAVVFDVGTNIGEVCMNAAALVGPRGLVYAFEPDPVSFRKFTGNLALNRFGNIFASNIGLGDVPGTRQMKVDTATNRGGNRIASENAAGDHFPIAIETLDRFVTQRELQRLDLVKIDVEGFELSVLRGAREALARFRPRLFIEVSDTNLREQGTSAAELVAYVRDAGYRVFRARSGEEIDETSALGAAFDMICRPTPR
jgi:FkbM family methyltransferase